MSDYTFLRGGPFKPSALLIYTLIIFSYIGGMPTVWALGIDPWQRVHSPFVNWEHAHVHPLDLSPDGTQLLAVNTPDNSLMVFNVTGSDLVQVATIPVGIDPVSVRVRNNSEAWVVNHVSDTISVVDYQQRQVIATLFLRVPISLTAYVLTSL